MKNIITIILTFLSYLLPAQQNKSNYEYVLKDKTVLSVEVCNNSIFRIRSSGTGTFNQSLMERYGIVRSQWPQVKASEVVKNDMVEISTDSVLLSLNINDGTISLYTKAGKILISSIKMTKEKTSDSKLMVSLSEVFSDEERKKPIIGDENNNNAENKSTIAERTLSTSIINIEIQPSERFYGLGSACRGRIQHRGHAARIWAQYQKSESPAPFIMSTRGWGIFNNTTSRHYFDVGRFDANKMFITSPSENVDFYLMSGATMPNVLFQYTEITGKPYILPRWAYGLAFGSNTMENQFNVMDNAYQFKKEKIPLDIYWLEPQWMATFYDFSTLKKWDLSKFPAEFFWLENTYPKIKQNTLFIGRLSDWGIKLALWLCIDHDMSIAEEDAIAALAGKEQSGKEHWFDHLMNFVDQGVVGFKLDPGRTLDEHPERQYYNGLTDAEMHQVNQVLLPKQMLTTFKNHTGLRSFHHYCGGYAGTQHWGAATCGDNGGGINALVDQLNHGLSANANTSCDLLSGVDDNIAGMHFGFFLPWVQLNSWADLSLPWYFKDKEKEAFRFYAQLRYSLIPYIYSTALNAAQTGMPIIRAMPLVFPNDEKLIDNTRQYMFGENFLVTAFSNKIYLPQGNWIDYWTGEKFNGKQEIECKIPIGKGGPLFVRAGAIIPTQRQMQYSNEFPNDTLILDIFPEGKSSFILYEDDGVSYDYQKNAIAKTVIKSELTGKILRLDISKREGKFNGITEHRSFIVHLHGKKPEKIFLNDRLLSEQKIEMDKKSNIAKLVAKIE